MTKWPKEKGQTVKPWSVSNTTQKAKDWATRIPQKNKVDGRICSPCSTSDTHRVALVTNLMTNHEWEKYGFMITTTRTYLWTFFKARNFIHDTTDNSRYLHRYWQSAPQFSEVRVKTMYDSPWLPFVWYEIHVLSMVFLFIYVYWCLTRFQYQMTSCRFTVTRRVSNVEQELITFP